MEQETVAMDVEEPHNNNIPCPPAMVQVTQISDAPVDGADCAAFVAVEAPVEAVSVQSDVVSEPAVSVIEPDPCALCPDCVARKAAERAAVEQRKKEDCSHFCRFEALVKTRMSALLQEHERKKVEEAVAAAIALHSSFVNAK